MDIPWIILGKSMDNPWKIKRKKGNVSVVLHGSPWVPMGSHGFPWVPMGSHGSPWGPHGVPMGSPWGPHGSPWASMENPRMSEIMDFYENHYSVRQKIGDPGPIKLRTIFRTLLSCQNFLNCHGFCMVSHGFPLFFHRFLIVFHGFS